MDEQMAWVPLDRLRAHPLNSNVMPQAMFEKLTEHIRAGGRYPPLVVRPLCPSGSEGAPSEAEGEGPMAVAAPRRGHRQHEGDGPRDLGGASVRSPERAGVYQVLDGHHRWRALEALGHERAACVVWPVDDEQALMLLSTLNRLEGRDDPARRAKLLGELCDRFGRGAAELARSLPDAAADLGKLLSLNKPAPRPAAPRALETMRRTVCFFLLPGEVRRLNEVLGAHGGSREAALMRLIDPVADIGTDPPLEKA